MLPGGHTFDDLLSKLIFYKQRLKFQSNCETPVHRTLVSAVNYGYSNQWGSSRNQNNGTSKGKNNGDKGCNKDGNMNNCNNNSQHNDPSPRSMHTGIICQF